MPALKPAAATEPRPQEECCVAAVHADTECPWAGHVGVHKLDTDTYVFSLCLKPFSLKEPYCRVVVAFS